MRQQLDIADVEASTKIRAKYLRALENEEFGLLPGSTFVKTFLRTYAELLGLDAHRLVEEYRANYEAQDEYELQPLGSPAVARRQRERRYGPPGPPNRIPLLAALVAIVLVFLIVLGLTGEENGVEERAVDRTETTPKRPARKPKRKPALTSVALRISPTVPTYACVDHGPGTDIVFEGTLAEARTFNGRKLRVNLGKTSVRLTANGKKVPIEPSPDPVGYEFSPRGNKVIPPEQRPCVA